jgi:transcription elongation GreA/GreB family factor
LDGARGARAYPRGRSRRDDWRELFVERLDAEPDPRALDLLAEALAADPDERSARGVSRFLDGLLTRPHQAPAAIVWLAERAADDAALRERNPLRLFQQILAALGRDELAPFRPRLRKLLVSGGTVPRLLPHLTEEQAPAAREALDRAAGLESFEREALVTALELRFPALRGEAANQVLYATPEAIDAKRAELDRLTREELPANRKAIEEARAMGDLRENFEYKSARQRHEYLSARAAGLHRDLERARPLDLSQVDPSEARIGTRVRLRDAAGEERELAILGPWESDPDRGVISYQSELAAALLGKRPGETVAAAGEPLTVVAIGPV